MIIRMVEDIGPELKLEIKTDRKSVKRIEFDNTHSQILSGSGNQDNPLRSTSLNYLLASEIAFWGKPDKAFDSIYPAMDDDGIVCLESTPNGTGNLFYEKYVDAKNAKYISKTTIRPCFYSWKDFKLFRKQPPKEWTPCSDDIEYMMRYGVLLDQAYWRRSYLESDNPPKKKLLEFARNYPINDIDCWDETTSGSPFVIEYLAKMKTRTPIKEEDGVRFYKLPASYEHYFIGVDTADDNDSQEGDDQAFCLINNKKEICATFNENIKLRQFAVIINKVGRMYNDAHVLIEANIGYIVDTILTNELDYPRRKVSREKTTTETRPILFSLLDSYIATQEEITDEVLKSQLYNFSLIKKDMKHIKDDLGFAFAWSLWCLDEKKPRTIEFIDPYIIRDKRIRV
jgi:hypothetical protein